MLNKTKNISYNDCFLLLLQFSGCVGIIDGTLVRISKPKFAGITKKKNKFYCRKHFFAWNCLGVVDNMKKFIWFTCKHPGRQHDSVMYNTSTLKAILSENFNFEAPRYLLGREFNLSLHTILIT